MANQDQAASAVVGALQQDLMRWYELDVAFHAHDFLLTDPAVMAALSGAGYRPAVETLLVRETTDALELSLFLDAGLLKRLRSRRQTTLSDPAALEDFWSALEGISHFIYLVFNAQRNQSVRAVELELQAEVDKYVMTLLSSTRHALPDAATQIHRLLFECTHLDPALDAAGRQRYRDADRHAARYCLSLARRFADAGNPGLQRELRRFYRLDHHAKLRFINQFA
ncbi:MAG TPA: hypothetical protein VFL15_02910 [Gammaproteobacteria bacterium]|nr:hypothetical protein [Gammaproteobacteria bacterium]